MGCLAGDFALMVVLPFGMVTPASLFFNLP